MSFFESIHISLKIFWIKLSNWEYWPFQVVYFPVFFYWLFLSIKSRSFFFFSTSNPQIKNAGFLMESKFDIYQTLPEQFYPKTILVNFSNNCAKIVLELAAKNMGFPIIAKPDIGMRGLKVKLLHSMEDLELYHSNATFNYLLQSFIPYENEVGIFYTKYPNKKKGEITGIVGKEFLTVIGDGQSSIYKLIKQNDRFLLQLNKLRIAYGDILENILPLNEVFVMVPYGNHSRGSKFIDLSHLIDEQLNDMIHNVCQQIPDFNYGRLDIKYKDWETLKAGIDFSIIEVNGAGSEPTHIYDPKHTIFFAWAEITKHLKHLYDISIENKEKHGLQFMTLKDGSKMLRDNKKLVASLL
jgi:hypothetical protein